MIPHLNINDRCVNCDLCYLVCPENSVYRETVRPYSIDKWSCTLCNLCVEVCPVDCIKLIEQD